MAVMHGRYTAAHTNAELVPAQDGKIIRITRLIVTTLANMKVTFVSNPGPNCRTLTSPLHVNAGTPLVVHLGRSGALVTERGKALGFTTVFQFSDGEYGIMVWYEAVD